MLILGCWVFKTDNYLVIPDSCKNNFEANNYIISGKNHIMRINITTYTEIFQLPHVLAFHSGILKSVWYKALSGGKVAAEVAEYCNSLH